MDNFEVELNESRKIIDFLEGVELEPNPEEFVRQKFIRILHYEYQYSKKVLAREIAIYYGSSVLKDKKGNPVRADIVVYKNAKARAEKDQGKIHFVVECKAPTEKSGYNQLVSYIYNTSAEGGVWFNGDVDSFSSIPQYHPKVPHTITFFEKKNSL
jgi:type I restriction enzyme M protein